MLIRAMRLADVEKVYGIAKHQLPEAWSEQQFISEVNNRHACHWVAEDVGGIWAFICVRVIAPEAEVLTLATHPDRVRRGLAKQLLDHALRVAYAQGCRRAYLEVRASNQSALNLYSGAGFERVGIRKGYYVAFSEDALVLARILTAG